MNNRTTRIASSLMSCSTTPRTTRRYLNELQDMVKQAERRDVLYSEAKNCMLSGDTESAIALLRLLPSSYRNVNAYMDQCTTYDALCRHGIVQRQNCVGLRNLLSEILSEDCNSHDIVRYADALKRNGFNEQSIRYMTVVSIEEALDVTNMSYGHRQLFYAYAETNTPWNIRTWFSFLASLQRCAPIVACIQQSAQKNRTDSKNTRSSARIDGKDPCDDRTEAGSVLWKTTEALMSGATNDDDDETAGDNND